MYAIHVDQHYFSGDIFGRDKTYLLRSDGTRYGEIVLFAERDDAVMLARLMTPHGVYGEEHNQYDRPEYNAVEYTGKSGVAPVSLHQACLNNHLAYAENGAITSPAAFRAWLDAQR